MVAGTSGLHDALYTRFYYSHLKKNHARFVRNMVGSRVQKFIWNFCYNYTCVVGKRSTKEAPLASSLKAAMVP
jgi:hypothetical protein